MNPDHESSSKALASNSGGVEARLHRLEFDGRLLQRGFWLYTWKIRSPEERFLVYVGRTGDSSSMNAQSPFNRLSQHLGHRERSSAMRNHLRRLLVDPERCSFELAAFGPILAEADDQPTHVQRRDQLAAYEAELARRISERGWQVINNVHSRKHLDASGFDVAWQAFSPHFPESAGRHRE